MTSFAVVKQVRERLGVRKAGHTGTLDPLATGVLPICLNEATKIAGMLLAEDKRYLATLTLGLRTDTYDITGRVLAEAPPAQISEITAEVLETALARFRGEQEQRPPAYSALHSEGKRAHELARAGMPVELALRTVTIFELRLERYEPPQVQLDVHCSKGTYVRSLAEDLGQLLGCGAALAELRRVQSGSFTLADAVALDALEPTASLMQGGAPLVSMDRALSHLPAEDLPDEAAWRRLAQGQPLAEAALASSAEDGTLARVRHQGQVVAIGVLREGALWPQRLLVPPTANV